MTIAALEQAITFISRTDLIATARQQPLPDGVTDLLKISSGDNEVLLLAQESSRQSQEDVRHAAEFYVQQILFSPDSDHYRILGVDPDDAEAKIKLHYRLLVRWLHPDKNSSDWEVVFSERVNRAWQALRTPERRRQYDEELSSTPLFQIAAPASREVKPVQWRDSDNDARFMSAKTIQRLPIVVFSLLGVGALLALLLFSQMQPKVQPVEVASNQSVPMEKPLVQESDAASLPEPVVAQNPEEKILAENDANGFIESVANIIPEEKQDIPLAQVAAAPAPVEKTLPVAEMKTPDNITRSSKSDKALKEKTPGNPLIVLADEEKPKIRNGRKNKIAGNPPTVVRPSSEQADAAANIALATLDGLDKKDAASDASVKQFLQRFSRVYADGDYFALHNLFTTDLSILGAAPQRTVLRSYRQLFDNSESRKIALDHVTWLASDEHIVVIASYEAEVMPRGKAEAKSSRGDIRLDLRVENGQLRIIRLQSDTKNG